MSYQVGDKVLYKMQSGAPMEWEGTIQKIEGDRVLIGGVWLPYDNVQCLAADDGKLAPFEKFCTKLFG